MKLLRVGEQGSETPCVMDHAGSVRNISAIVSDIGPETIDGLKEKLAEVDLETCPIVQTKGRRIGAPSRTPRNIICIGLNYSDHAEETGQPIPSEPILFSKFTGTYCGPNDPILFSPEMTKLDWEIELGVVIGKPALRIAREEAIDHVLGYTVVNDVSERAWQLERGGQWMKGKGFPNFCPTGPWIVTPDEIQDPQSLGLWLDVNGQAMQRGSTSKMIFDVATIVSYLSEFCRLEPGDLICTGTPPGVGLGQNPPRYLGIGDTVSLGIDALGEQSQKVVSLGEAA